MCMHILRRIFSIQKPALCSTGSKRSPELCVQHFQCHVLLWQCSAPSSFHPRALPWLHTSGTRRPVATSWLLLSPREGIRSTRSFSHLWGRSRGGDSPEQWCSHTAASQHVPGQIPHRGTAFTRSAGTHPQGGPFPTCLVSAEAGEGVKKVLLKSHVLFL